MKVEADALAVEIKKDFPSCNIEVYNSDSLAVSDSFAAGMYYREYYDSFVKYHEYGDSWHPCLVPHC
jgi:hypothetical protein